MRLLMRYALEYERNSYKGLFSFLQYLDRMDELQNGLAGVSEAKDERKCVRLMSVHKSKGLEFPVCFFVDAGRRRVAQDGGVLVTHRGLGVASKIRTDGSLRECTPLPYEILRDENRALEMSEEMRVLYVALTRARTHLFVSACITDSRLKTMMAEVASAREGDAPTDYWSTPSALKWMVFALRDQADIAPLYRNQQRVKAFQFTVRYIRSKHKRKIIGICKFIFYTAIRKSAAKIRAKISVILRQDRNFQRFITV